MYLSKISTIPDTSAHRLVMAGFPSLDSSTPRADLGILYRVEPGDSLLVQSAIAPNWGRVLPSSSWQTRKYDPDIRHDSYRFRMTINPVAVRDRRRVPIPPDEWLSRRDFGADFTIYRSQLHRITEQSSTGHRVVICAYALEGVLSVYDPPRLATAVQAGMGKARAYGCGLLTVVPTHSAPKTAETSAQ